MTFHRFRYATKLVIASLVVIAAAQGSQAAAQDSGVTVTSIELATTLENGQAVSPTTTFARGDGNIYAVVRVQNPTGAETAVRVSLEPVDGAGRTGISLPIPARNRYRTVARMSARRPAGRYRMVVRTEDGRELSAVELTVTE